MALIISDNTNANYDGNLSTANAWYRVEAQNLGSNSTTVLGLGTTRTISVTFANAGNCQGLIIGLYAPSAGSATSLYKSVTVKLQELVLGVWTDRATKTFTASEITSNSTWADGCYIKPFRFATPYAVTTAGGTWRFEISNATGTNNWNLWTSDGTNPFYITWCDNQMSFTSADTIVVMDSIAIDATTTLSASTSYNTGDTARAPSAIVCANDDPTPDNVSLLTWDGSASRTLTVNTFIMLGAHSGFRAGTSASPITYANRGKIIFTNPTTIGSYNGFMGICAHGNVTNTAGEHKVNVFVYGEVPSNRVATLASTANNGQPDIVTTSDMSGVWQVGDLVSVGGTGGSQNFATNTIASFAGTTITLTNNIVNARSATAKVFNMERFGFELAISNTNTAIQCILRYPNNLILSGCVMQGVGWKTGRANNETTEDGTNQTGTTIDDCVSYRASATGVSSFFTSMSVNHKGFRMRRTHLHAMTMQGSFIGNSFNTSALPNPTDGALTVQDCIFQNYNSSNWNFFFPSVITGNHFCGHQSGNNYAMWINGDRITCTGNEYLNNSVALVIGTIVSAILGENRYNGNSVCININGYPVNELSYDDIFGDVIANDREMEFGQNNVQNVVPAFDFELKDMEIDAGGLTLGSSQGPISGTIESILRVTNFDGTAKDDRGYLTNGLFQRTGIGLSDTTTRTSGGYAIRLQPNRSPNVLSWPHKQVLRRIPTGDIQNQTMTLSVWCYINNTAYDAGTYQYPRLYVKYDNATTSYAEATATFGSWQRLTVTFTPTTDFGQIEAWVTCMTDATTSNAYVYFDDFEVQYPAGYVLNLGALDLWANATPVWPPISTLASVGSVWDELLASHTVSGSFGKFVAKLLTVAKFIGLK